MDTATENALASIAKTVITEFKSPSNTLSYRELLDKHSQKIAPALPDKPPAWLQLNYVCHRVYAEK